MNRSDVLNTVIACIVEAIPNLDGHNFEETNTMEELGADSMNKADIIMLSLEELELNIPRVEAFGPTSLGELTDLFYGKLG